MTPVRTQPDPGGQEALGLMAPAFQQVEPGNRKFIEAIVATYIEKDEYQVGSFKKDYKIDQDNSINRF